MAQDVTVRGWCPGALRPMVSGDGMLVRVRPRAGAIPTAAVAAVAGAAARFGNGMIDLTRRGNLQIRGVTEDRLAGLLSVLNGAGLLDASPEAEAVRNVLVNPLAGIDPGETADLRPVARVLEQKLASDETLHRLPGKFSFLIDGGGRLPLVAEAADIRLDAEPGGQVRISLARPVGSVTLARLPVDRAARAAADLARAISQTLTAEKRRARAIAPRDLELILAPLTELALSAENSRPPASAGDRHEPVLGPLFRDGKAFAAGFAAPFGRIGAEVLLGLCDRLRAASVTELRIAPWRAIYVAVADDALARVLDAAMVAGLILDAADPLLSVDACPGMPSCASASVETRKAAALLAARLADAGLRSLHVSGCAKGCARSLPADLVLVGDRGRYRVVRGGTAGSPPTAFVHQSDPLSALVGGLAHD